MHVTQEGNQLVIRIDMAEEPKVSSSGKSKIIASSHGNQPIAVNIDGKAQVAMLGVNCFMKA